MGWLDTLPPAVRHLLLMMVATALAWAGQDVVPWLQGQGGYAAVLAPLLVLLINAGTTATRQYGVGSQDRPEVRR